MAKEGDRVQVITKEETLEGVLMPAEKDFVVIKLESGYNLGISKARVKDVKVIAPYVPKKPAEGKEHQQAGLPKIAILHTGGTIASKVDYETGAVVARFTPEELISLFPEIKGVANITSRLVRSMFSEDMRFAHYNILAKEVEKEINDGADGVIITHGTDTLHYTAAALSFMLQRVPVPVILVGAQRSSDRGSSDAGLNLLSAAYFISQSNLSEIAICMHETEEDEACVILPGTKTRKMHSSRRDAFKAINTQPWARVHFKKKKIELFKTNYHKKPQERPEVKARFMKEDIEVGILKVHPNMSAEQFAFYHGWDGLIIEGLGIAGHVPINEIDEFTKEHAKIYGTIKDLVQKGVIVAATTQTIYGGINMNVYSTGRKMQDAGIIGNYLDMTPETAFIKLAWLISNYPKEEVPELFCTNLVGEISSRLEVVEE